MGSTEQNSSESQIQLSKTQLTKALEKSYGSFIGAIFEPFKNATMYVLNMPDVSARAMENIIKSRTEIQEAIMKEQPNNVQKPTNLSNGTNSQIKAPERKLKEAA